MKNFQEAIFKSLKNLLMHYCIPGSLQTYIIVLFKDNTMLFWIQHTNTLQGP